LQKESLSGKRGKGEALVAVMSPWGSIPTACLQAVVNVLFSYVTNFVITPGLYIILGDYRAVFPTGIASVVNPLRRIKYMQRKDYSHFIIPSGMNRSVDNCAIHNPLHAVRYATKSINWGSIPTACL